MGQVVAGAVGAVIGFYVGGPAGAQWGYAIGSAAYAVSQPGPHSEGPKLNDLRVTGTDYGQPIPYIFGHPRISGQVVYSSAKREIATTTEQGKGGGPSYTAYTYEVDLLYLLTDNPSEGVSRIWDNGKLIWSALQGSTEETLEASENSPKWTRMTFYGGADDQLPDPTYEAAVGIGRAPAFRGRGSIFIEGLKLGTSGQLPNLTFEMARVAEIHESQPWFLMNFDGNLTDSAPDPLSTSLVDNPSLISYVPDPMEPEKNWIVMSTTPGGTANVTWTGPKISSIVDQPEDFTIECRAFAEAVPPSGTSDAVDIFSVSNHAGERVLFSWRVVDSVLVVGSGRQEGGGSTSTQYYGPPVSDIYRIVFGADGVTRWYNGELLLRSEPNVVSQGFVALSNASYVSRIGDRRFEYFMGYFGDRPSGFTVELVDEPIEDVVEALMLRCGYESSEFDVSALSTITKPVRALSVASIGATRATLELLMQAYYFDCVLSDKLYFRPRATTPTSTITWDELGASNSPEGDQDPLSIKYRNELEIPAQIAVSYINVANDYQTGTEFSDRAISEQSSTTSVQIGLGMMPAEAKGIADALVMDNYASIAGTTLKIPFTRDEIEPTDIVTAVGDGESYRLRIIRKNDAGGILELEAVVDDVNSLLSAQITDEDYVAQTDVDSIASTLWDSLDIPILRDADNAPGWYVAAKRADDGTLWPGAGIFQSWDGVSYNQVATFTSESVFGYAVTALNDWADGNVFDERSSVQVNVGGGSLSSSTRTAMLSDLTINVLLVGNEIIRFRAATLNSPGVYTLTGLLRGFRGTQWAMTGHASSEAAVLLTSTGLRRVASESSQINVPRYVEGVTFNMPLSSATPELFTDTGIALKPFAPTDLRVARDSSGDITTTWKRMTRLSFRFLSPGIDPPLGEATELYDAEIYTTSGYTTVARTFSNLASPEFDYTAAEQTTDFGSPQATIYARIYQRSAIVGRGYALQGAG